MEWQRNIIAHYSKNYSATHTHTCTIYARIHTERETAAGTRELFFRRTRKRKPTALTDKKKRARIVNIKQSVSRVCYNIGEAESKE